MGTSAARQTWFWTGCRPGRERAEAELGSLLFDVEGQDALSAYLHELYGARLSVGALKGGAPTLLRLVP